MPTIIINKNVLEQYVGMSFSPEELREKIPMLGVNLESIELDQLHIEIFPNRPDLLSEQGFSRAFASFLGIKTGLQNYPVKKSGGQVMVDSTVTMRPYTACAIVKNLRLTDERIRELMQLQEKLATTHGRNRQKSAYGIYPLEGITFPVAYTAKEPDTIKFKPLGFSREIVASEVLEIHPKGKMYRHITEGWKKFPFFIDAKNKVLSMLPFTNSEDTGKIEENTKEVFIECTGTDRQNVTIALNIIVTTLADMGGDVYGVDIVYPHTMLTTPQVMPTLMKLDLAYINKRLGLELSEREAVSFLAKMGYGFSEGNLLIPSYRADILHQADLAEDVAIAYGLENFEEKIPNVATIGEENYLEKFFHKVRDVLTGLQLLEAKNYHLTTEKEMRGHTITEQCVPLKNAVGDYAYLRHSLLPSLLKNLHENQHHEYPQNLFELGRVFKKDSTMETGIRETEHLGIVLCHDKADFTAIRQVLDALFTSIGAAFSVKENSYPGFIDGRAAEIILDGKSIGLIGEIHPSVLQYWELTMPVVAFELNVEEMMKKVRG